MPRDPRIRSTVDEDARAISRWRNAIICAFGMGGITVASWGPRMPAIRTELGVGTGTIGLLLACSTVGSIAGLLTSRYALHRLGGRGAVLSALLVVAAALVVMGVGVTSGAIVLVAIGFTVVGFGLGNLDVAINVEGAAVERRAGRTLLPLMHSAWSGGAAIGAAIGALCAATGVKPQVQFLLLAVLVAAVGQWLSRSIPAEAPPEAEERASEPWATRLRRWLRGWTDRRLLLIGIVLFGVEFGEGSANNWLALAVKQNHGQTAALAALFLALFAVSEMTARVVAGPLVDRLGRVRVLRYTTALGIVGVAVFILVGSIWMVAVGVVLWAIGVSMGFPLGLSAAAEGDDPPTQVSVAASIGYLSSLIGPPVIGFLAESVGLLSALWCLAGLFLAACLAGGALRPTVPSGVGAPRSAARAT